MYHKKQNCQLVLLQWATLSAGPAQSFSAVLLGLNIAASRLEDWANPAAGWRRTKEGLEWRRVLESQARYSHATGVGHLPHPLTWLSRALLVGNAKAILPFLPVICLRQLLILPAAVPAVVISLSCRMQCGRQNEYWGYSEPQWERGFDWQCACKSAFPPVKGWLFLFTTLCRYYFHLLQHCCEMCVVPLNSKIRINSPLHQNLT